MSKYEFSNEEVTKLYNRVIALENKNTAEKKENEFLNSLELSKRVKELETARKRQIEINTTLLDRLEPPKSGGSFIESLLDKLR